MSKTKQHERAMSYNRICTSREYSMSGNKMNICFYRHPNLFVIDVGTGDSSLGI